MEKSVRLLTRMRQLANMYAYPEILKEVDDFLYKPKTNENNDTRRTPEPCITPTGEIA